MKSKIKEILKRQKGITLVALVITIVILIILATVTINFAFGVNVNMKMYKILNLKMYNFVQN